MELLKNFVITLVTTLIFMTAIELIGPDNSMKKYLKFVMGLILIAVMLNPIIKFFSDGQTVVTNVIDKYGKEIDEKKIKDDDKEKEQYLKEKSFKDNFNKNCENLLSKEFKNMTFKSEIDCNVNFNKMNFEVNELKVYVSGKGVKKVEKVEIGKDGTQKEKIEDSKQKEIKDFLGDELGISSEKILVYYI